jgi:DNA-binding GntR family transcriptional regulator
VYSWKEIAMDGGFDLGEIEQLPLGGKVHQRLRQAIVQGILKPGERLIEQEIASQLRVSRTPVREAIRLLASEGLVTVSPRKGVIVEHLSVEDMAEATMILEVVEGLAARLAAQRSADQDHLLAQMENIIEESEAANARHDIPAVNRLNSQFHELLISASGSRRLQDLVMIYLRQFMRYRPFATASSQRRARISEEHRAILSALRNGRCQDAESLVRRHIAAARAAIAEELRKTPNPLS